MEQDLLRYLLTAFPTGAGKTSEQSSPENSDTNDHLVIRGYRVPFESPVDDVMLAVLADFRRSGFSREDHPLA